MYLHRFGAEGPLVVLLHGIPGSAGTWLGVAERLAGSHRVLVPDLIGFGKSRRSDRIGELWADAQAEALEKLIGEPAVIAGHDFGGPVALTLFGRRPDLFRRLVLLATNAFADTPIPLPIRAVRWPLVGGIAEHVLMSGPGLRLVAGGNADVGDGSQVRATRRIFATALRELRDRYEPIEAVLPLIEAPATVVWGDEDPFFSVEQGRRLAASIPGARFRLLSGAGHFLPVERPGEVAEEIAA
jgi:pimeloyl-ACP methyl ester carboxylesterase